MSEEKKPDWKFDFLSKESVEDFAGSVVRAENVCQFLVDHLPANCGSVTQFATANLLVIAEHSLKSVRNILLNYQKMMFDVSKSDQSAEAGSAE